MKTIPPDKPFSRLVRETRRQRRLSQQEVAESVGVRQNTVSSWERGVQLPPTGNEDKVAGLARALGLDEPELAAALHQQLDLQENQRRPGADQAAYLEERAAFLDGVGRDQCDIWVLVGDRFPAVDEGAMRSAWISDIRRGATYRLVWFLDLLAPRMLDRTARSLWEMGVGTRTAYAERPGLVHYPTTAMFSVEPKPAQFDTEDVRFLRQIRDNWESYRELAAEEVPKNRFKPFHYVNLRTRRALIEHLGGDGPVELLLPRHRRVHPLSSVCVRSGRADPRSDPAPVWVLHDADRTYRLREAVQTFEAAHGA